MTWEKKKNIVGREKGCVCYKDSYMVFSELESTGTFSFFFKSAALHAESDLHHSPYSTSNNPLFNKSVKHLY